VPDMIQVTQADVDNVARKLEEFSAVLSDRERAVLMSVIGIAGQAIDKLVSDVQSGGGTAPGGAAAGGSLSQGFRDAFARGVGTKFAFSEPSETEQVRNIKIDGDWGNT
jgi:hypothetical protein